MPLRVFVIHWVAFLSVSHSCSFLFPESLTLSFTSSLLGSNATAVTCSFCLYPFSVSFVVTLLYKRISKGNILSPVTLYCTLDTSGLKIYWVLRSFSYTIFLHLTAGITAWYNDKQISLDLSQMGRIFDPVFTGQFCRFWKMGSCSIIALSTNKLRGNKTGGSTLYWHTLSLWISCHLVHLQTRQPIAVNSKWFSAFVVSELKFSFRERLSLKNKKKVFFSGSVTLHLGAGLRSKC